MLGNAATMLLLLSLLLLILLLAQKPARASLRNIMNTGHCLAERTGSMNGSARQQLTVLAET